MPTALDPFRIVVIALAGWMNQRQLRTIEYLREENLCVDKTFYEAEGKGNVLLFPDPIGRGGSDGGRVECRARLGGLLRHDARAA